MSAADIVQAWITERDAVLEADAKGLERSPSPSVTAGSWNGSATDDLPLRIEANVLHFLQRALEDDDAIEQARATAGPPPLSREDAREAVLDATGWLAGQEVDAILDALGWPS